ncbi:MAG: glycosyltransferase family 4 protein, partial [bacterium]
IVHTHLHKADFYGRIVAKQLGVPVIVSTCHNYSTNHKYADINRKSYFDRIDNLVVNYSDSYLIAISGLVKEYLTGRDKTFLNRTEVIYNGVDITKEKYLLSDKSAIIEFRDKWGFDTDDFVISIIGRLEEQKGHLFFLRSMKDILKENKKIKILIVGDGSLRNEIENYISENNLGTSVITTGFIPDSQKYIEISDLIAVPSLWEGFGLVIIEGMIKNKIILASDTGGIPEIIEDDRTGFLFALNNKKNFLDKFNYIYDNLNELDEIKKNSLELVKEKFDMQKNSELYYQYYINKLSIINSNPTK